MKNINNEKYFNNLSKDINYIPDNSFKEGTPNSILKNQKNNNLRKVQFTLRNSQMIELSNNIKDAKTNKSSNLNELIKTDTEEDDDILKKFQIDLYQKKRRKNLDQNIINREKGFSVVNHQIREEFSLYKLGKIEWAKRHSSANRPMNKLQQFTKETNFCNCCNLPCETPGIIEPFSSCEDTDNFSICGKGIPLYFFFFRYCIVCLIVVSFVMTIPMTMLNNKYLIEIKDYCTYKKDSYGDNFKTTNLYSICDKYLEKNNSLIANFLNWFWKINNLYDYGLLLDDHFRNITSSNINNIINPEYDIKKKICPNFSIIGLFCMISLFIINIFFIILLKASIKTDKIENVKPSDYTVLITDLQNAVKEFKEKNEENEYSMNEMNNLDNLTGGIWDNEYNNMDFLKTKTGQFTQFIIDNLFYSQKAKHNLNIYNLNLCYKLNEFMILKKQYEKCKYKIFQVENNPYQREKNNDNDYFDDERRYYSSPFTYIGLNWLLCSNKGVPIKKLYADLQEYDRKLNLLVNKAKLDNFCGCIFVTFNTIKDKQEFYNRYPHFFIEFVFFYIKNIKYYLCCCFIDKKTMLKHRNRKRMRVYLAPEPEDIIWENMEFTLFQKLFRILIIYLITIVLIFIAYQIVYLLNQFQEDIKEGGLKEILKYSASFSITIVISILNIILEFILKIFTKIEKLKSKTNYYLSFSIKLTIFTLMTSALVPVLSNYLNRKENGIEYNNNKILITNMIIIFLVNSFVTPLVWTLNIPLIIKKIKIYLIERKENPDLVHFKTQKELNDIYEFPDMQIASKYSYITKTVLMTMFYLPIFPLGVSVSLSGLIIAYFLEKYNFTHSYKRPEMLNEKLGEFYFNFFIYILLSFCFGNYFFMVGMFEKDSWRIINILFFAILSIIPYTKPIQYYFNNKIFDIDSKPINEIYFSFCNDYQRQNPFTKKEGMYFYITELKNKGYVSKFIYDILLKNIEKINVMEIYYDTCMKPSLSQTQTALARVNNGGSIEDLKRSIKRIGDEKEKMGQIVKNRVKSDYQKNYALVRKSNLANDAKENNNEKKNEEENEENMVGSMKNNSFIGNKAKNEKDDEPVADNNRFRRNTETPKYSNKLNKLYENDGFCLTEAFTNKDNFLINQYKNPLLLNIGLGIKNLAFVDGSNNFKSFSKKSNIKRVMTRMEKEDSEVSEDNDSSLNSLVNEKDED